MNEISGELEGRYFTIGTSACVHARLKKQGDFVQISLNGSTAGQATQFTSRVVEISDRLANVARKLTLEDGSVFEVRDNEGVDALFHLESGFFSRLTRVETSYRLVAVVAFVTIGLLGSLYRFGLPMLANSAAKITPTSMMTLMDRGTLSTIDRLLFDPSKLDNTRQREVTRLFAELADQSGLRDPPLRLLFRDGGKLGANALALPGGTIIITDQLIKLAKSDDEIAGVIGHEIGHVELRHSLRQIYRVLGIGFMISVIGGDSGQLVEDVIAQAAALESLSYSRQFETESDFRGAELMVSLDRDPFAFIALLKRITPDKGEKPGTGWFTTHPGTF